MYFRLLLASCSSALVLVAAAAGSPQWHSPVELSSSDRALGPELAVHPNGEAVAVWDHELGADCPTSPASLSCIHIVEAASRARGTATWQAPVEIARPGIGALPRVAVDSRGDAAIIWVHDIGDDRVVQATIRPGPGGRWPNPNDLSSVTRRVRNHQIALDDAGDAVAVWSQEEYVVGEMRSAAAGVWGAPVALSILPGDVRGGPNLALAPTGEALVAWVERGELRACFGHLPTAGWGAPVTLSRGLGSVAGDTDTAVALSPGGAAVVVWSWLRATGQFALQAAFRPAGGTWGEPVDVAQTFVRDVQPQVAIDGAGNVVAIWRSVAQRLRAVSRPRASGAWSPPVDVAGPDSLATAPRLAMDAAGNAVAAWTNSANGITEAALRPAASGAWQPRTPLSGPGTSGPRVAIDAGGNAVAVWNRDVPPRIVVEAADLTAGGPILGPVRVPNKVVARVPATFVVATAVWAAPVVGSPSWQFGDGGSARGLRVKHRYKRPGRYRVSVTQSDAVGGASTVAVTVKVRPRSR